MDEIGPVYDLFCPSPVPLQDLASFELALNIWQREIFEHRVNKTLRLWESISNTRPARRMPNLPPKLAPGIDKRIEEIIKSIDQWFRYHNSRWRGGFRIYDAPNSPVDYSILNHFVDFVLDWDGSIHYERTAQRMMLCYGIDVDLKFKIACVYFLEEDIVKLWPSVASYMLLNRLDFNSQPELYYWVARMRNQLHKVPLDDETTTVSATVLRHTKDGHLWPVMKYFPTSTLPENASESTTFVRYLLPKCKVDEEWLPRAIRWFHTGSERFNSSQILKVWAYIKDKITRVDCILIIRTILNVLKDGNYFQIDPFVLVELWNSTSNDFKQFAVEEIFKDLNINPVSIMAWDRPGSTEFLRVYNPETREASGWYGPELRELSLLMEILSYASATFRNQWWRRNSRNLISGTKCDELIAMMELCIGDPAKIDQFKRNLLSECNYGICTHCFVLLREARFIELDQFLRLCCPDECSMRKLREEVLFDCRFKFKSTLLDNAGLFKQYIYDSYTDLDAANDYITGCLLSRSVIEHTNFFFIGCKSQFQAVMQFIDTFATSHQLIAVRIKRDQFVPALLSLFTKQDNIFCLKTCSDDLGQFLTWCLRKDEDEIVKFKEQINLDNLIRGLVRKEARLNRRERTRGKLPSHCMINQLIEWCLGTDQAVAEFKRKYARDKVFAEWFWV